MYTTDAIVLKKLDIGEHDALYMLYTREYGKMRAVATGIKKPEAKLRGHLEPLSLARVRFVAGKNRDKLIGATLINFWPRIRQDHERLCAAYHMASRIDRECMEGQKDEALWELMRRSFSSLETGDDFGRGIGIFINRFEDDLRDALGYGRSDSAGSGIPASDYGILGAWPSWTS